jgi:hypothetical protein
LLRNAYNDESRGWQVQQKGKWIFHFSKACNDGKKINSCFYGDDERETTHEEYITK